MPKIFFIDACRGSQEETITKFEPTRSMVTRYSFTHASLNSQASTTFGTASAHFAILYASTHGNVAYITESGSQLTQTFVKVATDATPDISFTDIIREVQTNIQESGAGQTVELVDRLNHPYYIKRFVQSILQ